MRLEQDALRLSYAAGDPEHIAAGHFNLANDLQRAEQNPAVAVAHLLASAVIRFQTGSGRLTGTIRQLAHDLAGFDGDPPGSFTQLCRLVDQTDGVHLAQLVDRLPKRAPDGEAALAEVLRLAPAAPRSGLSGSADRGEDVPPLPDRRRPVVAEQRVELPGTDHDAHGEVGRWFEQGLLGDGAGLGELRRPAQARLPCPAGPAPE